MSDVGATGTSGDVRPCDQAVTHRTLVTEELEVQPQDGEGVSMRVLVSAASTHGATAEIGRGMAETLRRCGIDVDVAQPDHITDLHRYDGFVLGSAIYRGRWKPEAVTLLRNHSEVIRSRPCWLFSSGPVKEGMPSEPLRSDEVASLMALSRARQHHLFGGRIDVARLSTPERWLARWARVRSSDARSWADIERWTTRVAAELIAGSLDSDEEQPEITA